MFIKRYGLEDVKLLPVSRVDILGTNKVDRERASKTTEIRDAYDIAVAELRDDF